MYSNKQNVLQLISLLQKAGIRDAVVCPGSRNAVIVHDLAEARIKCHPVTDERSAGFYAIGISNATNRPVVVCVTSGSAVLNLAPSVAEAYYQKIPIIYVTADRPERWIGQMDGQTMPQQGAFGTLVHKSVSLPETPVMTKDAIANETSWHANRLINEALIAMRRHNGPVHINVPITEPLFSFCSKELPDERYVQYERAEGRGMVSKEAVAEWKQAKKKLIIVGQLHPSEAKEISDAIEILSEDPTVVVIGEELSNLNDLVRGDFDDILTASDNDKGLVPEIVVTIGGHIVSKNLKKFIRSTRPIHWHVSPDGELADTYMCATRVIESSPLQVLNVLSGAESDAGDDVGYSSTWTSYESAISDHLNDFIIADGGDLNVLLRVKRHISPKWDLHVANSSIVRNLQIIRSKGNKIFCNRGINGIEGSVSEAVGYWSAGTSHTLLIVGDLSFFYDQNGLWNQAVMNVATQRPLRIIVINNGGGQIFRTLPGLEASQVRDEYISAKHCTSAKGIAEQTGCIYCSAKTSSEIDSLMPQFLDLRGSGVAIFEVFTDPDVTERENRSRAVFCKDVVPYPIY